MKGIHIYVCVCVFAGVCVYVCVCMYIWGFPGGSVVKNPPANAGDTGSILVSRDPLEKEMAIHSSTLAWEIPLTEKPGWL